jgi:hypothetical protein
MFRAVQNGSTFAPLRLCGSKGTKPNLLPGFVSFVAKTALTNRLPALVERSDTGQRDTL